MLIHIRCCIEFEVKNPSFAASSMILLLLSTCSFFSLVPVTSSQRFSCFLLSLTSSFIARMPSSRPSFFNLPSMLLRPWNIRFFIEVARENIIYFRSYIFTCVFDSQLSRLGPEFWINLYNALIMHANVVVGNAKTPEERGEYNLLPSEILAVGFD